MSTLTKPPLGRLRAAWAAAHTPVAGVASWVRIAAYTIPFIVLPSGLWRIAAVTFHAPIGQDNECSEHPSRCSGDLWGWLPVELYVVLLSIVAELLAFTAIGLIARWGEVFPRWIPGLRGRRVPVLAAVIPATAGATILTAMWTRMPVLLFHPRSANAPHASLHWQGLLFFAAYAPLVLWGPLLAIVTVSYWRRRRRA